MLQEIKDGLIKTISLTVIGILIGVAMILIPHDKLIHFSFIILGISIILFMLPELIHQVIFFRDEPFYEFIITCIIMALGFVLIFWQRTFVFFMVGGVLIVLPIVKILTSFAKMAMFRTQLPCLILGVVILLVGPARYVNILFSIAGYTIIALSVAFFVYSLLFLLPSKKSEAIQKEFTELKDE